MTATVIRCLEATVSECECFAFWAGNLGAPMSCRRLIVALLLLTSHAFAQYFKVDNYGNVRVRVTFSDGHRCHMQVHLILMGGTSNTPVAESYSNDECMADFGGLGVGNYHIVVSGEGLEETDSGVFEVDSRKSSQSVFITVRRKNETDSGAAGSSGAPMVAAVDLNVPDSARREYEKAAEPFDKGNWKKAKQQLEKAVAIYPRYAAAYNDLGVVYGRLGDRLQERQALQKAVSLNDHFSEAYVNLGKMAIIDRSFPDAENYLNRAAGSDPNNPQTLMLLANVELLNQHFDQSIANCHKVHTLPHKLQSLVHYIAARAMLHQNRQAEALYELQVFLTEEPSGPRADAVRTEMSKLQGTSPTISK